MAGKVSVGGCVEIVRGDELGENMCGYPDDLRDLSPDETKNTPRDNYTPYPTPYSVRNCQSGGL